MWRGRISENKGVGETSVGESCGVLQRKFTVDRERVDCIRGLQHNFTLDRGEWTVFAVYNVNLRWIGGEWGYYACSLVKKNKKQQLRLRS